MMTTVRGLADAAFLCGVPPSVLLERLLCSLEDDPGGDSEGVAHLNERGRGDVPLVVEVVEHRTL